MNIVKKFTKSLIGQKIVGFIIFLLTKSVFLSIKWRFFENKNLTFKNNTPYIFCCWHNRLFLGPYFLPKNLTINALQSSHSDGMMTAIIFKLLNMKIIFGSSMKGGTQAFIKMVKSVNNGESIAITPDGPRGPKQKVKDGLIKLAQVTGAPIIPLVWFTSRYKRLNSWDSFIIPIPFSKGNYFFGDPIYIERNLSKNQFDKIKKKVENDLNKLTALIEKKSF